MTEPGLPPDLSRLGDQLVAATERRIATRRRRAELFGKLATTGVAGALLFAALTPGTLDSADRGAELLRLAAAPAVATVTPSMCDQPRRATFASSGPCNVSSLVMLRRAYAWQ
jgi:hypothetical protein